MIDLIPSPLSAKGHWKRDRLELPLKPAPAFGIGRKAVNQRKIPAPLLQGGGWV